MKSESDRKQLVIDSYKAGYTSSIIGDIIGVSERTIQRDIKKLKKEGVLKNKTFIPKILLFDLETSPLECYTWQVYNQFINPEHIIKNTAILTWSAKWLCGDEMFTAKVSPKEAINREDKSVINKLWTLIDSADIIIAHNLRGFDEKVANTRFIVNGLKPPSPYRVIDTLHEIKKIFKFSSNKLDQVNSILGLKGKIETSFNLWKKCVNGNQEALDEMLKYNSQDVLALEELYFQIRPWIKAHPNLGLYYEDCNDRCSNCGSTKIKESGYYTTNVNKYQALRCEACGAYMRKGSNCVPKENKINLLRSIGV